MRTPTREQLLYLLYEAAELEHDVMCTYLYAAFTIKTEAADGITAEQAARASRWRRAIMNVAIGEMSHLVAVCNITSAIGGSPRFGRSNFPIEAGALPASVVARLAPFDDAVLQHFIYLERPGCSRESDGTGFTHGTWRNRATPHETLTPRAVDYSTIGEFYKTLGQQLCAFVKHRGEEAAFCNDPAFQLTTEDTRLPGLQPVHCSKSALAAFTSIVEQGEGASSFQPDSHFQIFCRLREELADAKLADPAYQPAYPAARDPVLRPPPVAEARVWIADTDAAATVDIANASYSLTLRLLAYAYQLPRGVAQKRLAIELGIGLMHAMTPIAERAVRLPAGPAHPGINAGMTFTNLRDASALPRGASSWRIFSERFEELVEAATELAVSRDPRLERGLRLLVDLNARARCASPARAAVPVEPPASAPAPAPTATAAPAAVRGQRTQGRSLAVLFDTTRCVHARQCVTGAPKVFVANVTHGPWIHPDEAEPERVIEVVHNCPSGALRYERVDGQPEPLPPVNLLTIRERGPYAVRADLRLAGESGARRLTLCRCGASKNKPFCDNSHAGVAFDATGEPPPTNTASLADRDGPLAIEPEVDGPLGVAGNLEITSGTGRVVARVTSAKLCRCGASATKPFCDLSHRRIGFRT
jgi:CDGSH-type Zn-finger protein/uncharacterized Fe-S cluster protein YjdI